jgi:hypothetical protein
LERDKAGKVTAVKDSHISTATAQSIKKNIYKQLGDAAYGQMESIVKENKKAFARGAKEEIAKQYPEIQQLNQRDSALLDLNEALDKAINRIGNREVFGLREFGALIFNPKLLIATLIDNPEIKSRLAIVLHKISKGVHTEPGKIRKAITPATRITQPTRK